MPGAAGFEDQNSRFLPSGVHTGVLVQAWQKSNARCEVERRGVERVRWWTQTKCPLGRYRPKSRRGEGWSATPVFNETMSISASSKPGLCARR